MVWIVCLPGVRKWVIRRRANLRLIISYADWISLNEPRLVLLRRNLNQLDLSTYNEAVGDLMRLELVIDGTDSDTVPGRHRSTDILDGLPKVETSLPTSHLLPPIRFHGSSVQQSGIISHPGASPASFVRGVVQLTADDPPQVRWTLVIRYGGADRWRLECVQVGGRGSGRGFFGVSVFSSLQPRGSLEARRRPFILRSLAKF